MAELVLEKNPPPSEEDREEPRLVIVTELLFDVYGGVPSSPAPCHDLVEGEDPDDFVSVEVPSLNDEDQGRSVMPLAGRRGGLLRRARKTKREASTRESEEDYPSGDISQVGPSNHALIKMHHWTLQLTTDEDHLFSSSVSQSILRDDMLISLSQAAIEASSITTLAQTTPTAELVTPADEESTKGDPTMHTP